MPLEIRIASTQQVRSGSGTQDWTVTGFGTPQAAIIYGHFAATDDADTANAYFCVGFYDGTTQACAYKYSADGVTTSSPHASGAHQDVFYLFNGTAGGNQVRSSTAASFITDGLRITFDAGTPQPYVTVVLIKGLTGAKVGYLAASASADGTATASSLGITPNGIIFANSEVATIDSNSGTGTLAIGLAAKVGSAPYEQKAIVRYANAVNPTTMGGYVFSTADAIGASYSSASGVRTRYELTNMGVGEFTVTTRTGTTNESRILVYLAFEAAATPDVFECAAPTSSGDWDPYNGTAKPTAVLMIPGHISSVDTSVTSGSGSAGYGFYLAVRNTSDDTTLEQFGTYQPAKDALATTDSSSRRSAKLIIQGEDAGTPAFEAASPSFDSSGLVFADANVTTASAAHRIIGMSFTDVSNASAGRMLLLGVG